jgi:dihydropteroate synthase
LTGSPPQERLEGSIAAAVLAVKEGADVVRVHDVPQTVNALKVANAIISIERR